MRDRATWAIYLLALLLSFFAHVATIQGLSSAARRRPRPRAKPVEMAIYKPPPPPPVVEAPPPDKREPDKPKPKPKPVDKVIDLSRAPPPKPTDLLPPSNSSEAAPPDASARPTFGISMSSTVGPGSGAGFTVRVGNTLMKAPEEEFTPPEEVKPYRKPVSLAQVNEMPKRQGTCKAEYPPEAKALAIEGKVKLRITVLADGSVGDVTVVEGLGHGLDEAAIASIKKCPFTPAMMGGQAVTTIIAYTFTFFLDD